MINNDLHEEIIKFKKNNNLFSRAWDYNLPNGSLIDKPIDSDTFGVQIFIPDHKGFTTYERIETELKSIVEKYGLFLDKSKVIDDKASNRGWFRELHFMTKNAYDEKGRKGKEAEQMSKGPVFNIHTINAHGSNFVFGDVDNSTLYIDQSVKNIKEMIEEKGGEDKEELLSILEDVKVAAEQIASTGIIEAKPTLKQKLDKHLEKHSWFYGEIIGLVGNVVVTSLFA